MLLGGASQRLLDAAAEGRADEVEQLLGTGASTVVATASGANALLLAASRGHAEVVRLLLAAGAAVNKAENSPEGLTPLLVAVGGGLCRGGARAAGGGSIRGQSKKGQPGDAADDCCNGLLSCLHLNASPSPFPPMPLTPEALLQAVTLRVQSELVSTGNACA